MHFSTKKYLKSNHYHNHTDKHSLKWLISFKKEANFASLAGLWFFSGNNFNARKTSNDKKKKNPSSGDKKKWRIYNSILTDGEGDNLTKITRNKYLINKTKHPSKQKQNIKCIPPSLDDDVWPGRLT
jgi:hypothetical protein